MPVVRAPHCRAEARTLPFVDEALLKVIVEDSARRYISQRHQKVAPFCAEHFSIQGAWRINRKAFGHDLWRAPANLLWAVPYLLSRGAANCCRKLGWHRGAAWLEATPPGFKTAVTREVEWLLYTELLELPFIQPERQSDRDALLELTLSHPTVAGLLLPALHELSRLGQMDQARDKLARFLTTYSGSRNAAADLAGSLLNLAAGAAAFHNFTPGAVAMGSAAATALAQQMAIAHFALGSTLGSLYYGLFPATVSAGLIAATVGGIVALTGVLTAFTGVVTDPIQQALGLHERRLHRLLIAMQSQWTGCDTDFRLRDAYVARVFDILDVVRSAVQVLRN